MTVETDRLLLRPFDESDWQDLHEYLSQPEVVRYEPYSVFTEKQSRKEAVRRASLPEFLAVCLKENGKLIGNVYFKEQEPAEFQTWELGYVLSAYFQGYGYAAEACRAILSHAFVFLRARRVVAMCNPLNSRSWRLLERLNFRREGHLHQNLYFKCDEQGNPIWCDTYEYAILADDWKSNGLHNHT